MKTKATFSFDDYMVEQLSDPEYAAEYLNFALEEFREAQDRAPLLRTLHYLAKSQGGLVALAEKTGLNRENLYRTLSENGNPQFGTLNSILNALGYRFKVERVSDTRD